MNEIIQNERKVKCKILIIILSAITFLFGGVGQVLSLIGTIINIGNFVFIDLIYILSDFSSILLIALAAVFMALTALCFYKKSIGKIFLAVTFVLLALPILNNVIYMILMVFRFGGFKYIHYVILEIWPNILDSIFRILLIFTAIFALVGINKKSFYIIPVAMYMFIPLYLINNYLSEIAYNLTYNGRVIGFFHRWYYSLGAPLVVIAFFAIGIALIIFIAENDLFIKDAKAIEQEETNKVVSENAKKLSSDVALIYLKEKFDNGDITEYEYQSQREIILNKI